MGESSCNHRVIHSSLCRSSAFSPQANGSRHKCSRNKRVRVSPATDAHVHIIPAQKMRLDVSK